MSGLRKAIQVQEAEIIQTRIPYIQRLIKSEKICMSEKIAILEDVNIDIAAYLLSIGEEI
jgi:hypothetical protein